MVRAVRSPDNPVSWGEETMKRRASRRRCSSVFLLAAAGAALDTCTVNAFYGLPLGLIDPIQDMYDHFAGK